MKKKVLNLYAGIGGNRKLWPDDEIEVTAVESNPEIAAIYQDFFPNDKVIIADAHEYLLKHFKEFDFIWSSPPCQSHSKMVKFTRHDVVRYPDFKLYEEIVFLNHFFKGKWVVENVKPYYETLINPVRQIGRHSFWCNFTISTCKNPTTKDFINTGTIKETENLKKWLGLEYKGNVYYNGNHCPGQVLRNCVHPEVGLHIYNQSKKNTIQLNLFK